jgi:hypothetical protein
MASCCPDAKKSSPRLRGTKIPSSSPAFRKRPRSSSSISGRSRKERRRSGRSWPNSERLSPRMSAHSPPSATRSRGEPARSRTAANRPQNLLVAALGLETGGYPQTGDKPGLASGASSVAQRATSWRAAGAPTKRDFRSLWREPDPGECASLSTESAKTSGRGGLRPILPLPLLAASAGRE